MGRLEGGLQADPGAYRSFCRSWHTCCPLSPAPPRPSQQSGRWEGGAGIDFKLHGFSHKLPLLAAYVFASLAGLEVQAEAFARVKEQLLRNVRGWGGVVFGWVVGVICGGGK